MKFKKATKLFAANKRGLWDKIKSSVNSKLNAVKVYYKGSGSKDKKPWKQIARETGGVIAGNLLGYVGALYGGLPGYIIGNRVQKSVRTMPNYDKFGQALMLAHMRNKKAKELREMRKARDRGALSEDKYQKYRDQNLNFNENTVYDKQKAEAQYRNDLDEAKTKFKETNPEGTFDEAQWKQTPEGKKASRNYDKTMINKYNFGYSKNGGDLYKTVKWKKNTVLSNLLGINLPAIKKLTDINRARKMWKNYKSTDEKDPQEKMDELAKKRKSGWRKFVNDYIIGDTASAGQ